MLGAGFPPTRGDPLHPPFVRPVLAGLLVGHGRPDEELADAGQAAKARMIASWFAFAASGSTAKVGE